MRQKGTLQAKSAANRIELGPVKGRDDYEATFSKEVFQGGGGVEETIWWSDFPSSWAILRSSYLAFQKLLTLNFEELLGPSSSQFPKNLHRLCLAHCDPTVLRAHRTIIL